MFPSLATQRNITRNIVSATMFPSLARSFNISPLHVLLRQLELSAKILGFMLQQSSSYFRVCDVTGLRKRLQTVKVFYHVKAYICHL